MIALLIIDCSVDGFVHKICAFRKLKRAGVTSLTATTTVLKIHTLAFAIDFPLCHTFEKMATEIVHSGWLRLVIETSFAILLCNYDISLRTSVVFCRPIEAHSI